MSPWWDDLSDDDELAAALERPVGPALARELAWYRERLPERQQIADVLGWER